MDQGCRWCRWERGWWMWGVSQVPHGQHVQLALHPSPMHLCVMVWSLSCKDATLTHPATQMHPVPRPPCEQSPELGELVVHGPGGLAVNLSMRTGALRSLLLGQTDFLASDLAPCFFRWVLV